MKNEEGDKISQPIWRSFLNAGLINSLFVYFLSNEWKWSWNTISFIFAILIIPILTLEGLILQYTDWKKHRRLITLLAVSGFVLTMAAFLLPTHRPLFIQITDRVFFGKVRDTLPPPETLWGAVIFFSVGGALIYALIGGAVLTLRDRLKGLSKPANSPFV